MPSAGLVAAVTDALPIMYVAGISPYPAAVRPVSTGLHQRNSPSALPGLVIGTEHRRAGVPPTCLGIQARCTRFEVVNVVLGW